MDNPHNWRSLWCLGCGLIHFIPVYCGDRFCQICNKARMTRIRIRLTDLVNKTELLPNENFRHLVLTIKSQENPAQMCRYLHRCFRKFRQTRIFKKNFSGGAFVIELTENGDLWHAHLHIIVQGRYIPQSIMLRTWRQIAGKAGLFIKTVPKKAIVNYLTKYLTKGSITGKAKEQGLTALKGLRLFTCFGSWHALLPSWTKIPFVCPDCNALNWCRMSSTYSDERKKRLIQEHRDEEKLEAIFKQRYYHDTG